MTNPPTGLRPDEQEILKDAELLAESLGLLPDYYPVRPKDLQLLLTRLGALRQERDKYKKYWDDENIARGHVEAEVTRLRAALKQYGRHQSCTFENITLESGSAGYGFVCRCGLSSLTGPGEGG